MCAPRNRDNSLLINLLYSVNPYLLYTIYLIIIHKHSQDIHTIAMEPKGDPNPMRIIYTPPGPENFSRKRREDSNRIVICMWLFYGTGWWNGTPAPEFFCSWGWGLEISAGLLPVLVYCRPDLSGVIPESSPVGVRIYPATHVYKEVFGFWGTREGTDIPLNGI